MRKVVKVAKSTRVVNGKSVSVRATTRVVRGKSKDLLASAMNSVAIRVSPELAARMRALCDERNVCTETLISVALRSVEAVNGRHYDLTTKIGFGKYAEESFASVAVLDPNYVRWMLTKIPGTTLTDRAQSVFNAQFGG